MKPRRAALVVAFFALHVTRAAAEPLEIGPGDAPVHVHSASRLTSDGGADLRLPPGYFVPEERWDAADLEMRRLQDAETRLTAENESLRASSGGWPGWQAIAIALAVGVGGGAYLAHRYW